MHNDVLKVKVDDKSSLVHLSGSAQISVYVGVLYDLLHCEFKKLQ